MARLHGRSLRDRLHGTPDSDEIHGWRGNDLIFGWGGADYLYGGVGMDSLDGGDGSDTLDGGRGDDRLSGGDGDDVYWIDSNRDTIVETHAAGQDWVYTSLHFNLPANVESLQFVGHASVNGRGNALDNLLLGNDAANSFDGGGGNDSLNGFEGRDRLRGGEGSDTLQGGKGGDELDGGAGADLLFGQEGDDVFTFDASDSAIDGGSGSDLLRIRLPGQSIDLHGPLAFASIEAIDMRNAGSDTLTLDADSVLDLSDTGTLRVMADAGDTVHIGTGWDQSHDLVRYRGARYVEYTQSGATLLVDARATVDATGGYLFANVYGDISTSTQPTPGFTFLAATGERIDVSYDPDYNYYGFGSDDLWYVNFFSDGTADVYNDIDVYQYTANTNSFAGWIGGNTIGVGDTGLFWENVSGGTYWLGRNGVLYNAMVLETNYGDAIN